MSFPTLLRGLPGVWAGWCGRIPELDVTCDRGEAMQRMRPHHESWLAGEGAEPGSLWRAEQLHGNRVAVVPGVATIEAADGLPCVPGVDGLITSLPGITLGIHVADCGPIWLVDPVRRVVGLLHSGKKGTEMDILGVALERFASDFGSRPADVIAVLGPCIRPPDYEVDFAATLAAQAARHGVRRFCDCGVNTAADLTAHYSYRRELGKTGRMLAAIRLES